MTTKAVLEERVKLMFERNSTEHQEIRELIENFIENADKKFASKLTEKIVYGMVGLILTAVIGSILIIILKP